MEPERAQLISIGAFAGLTYLSMKALRLYDQLGLLTPAYIDPESNYRYYHPNQLLRARLIRQMRLIDMPLAQIRQTLAAEPPDAAALVERYMQDLEEHVQQARRLVPDLIAQLRGEVPVTTITVQVRDVDTQAVLSITDNVTVDRLVPHIQACLKQIYAAAEQSGVTPTGAPFGLYHGPINQEEHGPIEVCVPVSALSTVQAPVTAKEMAATRVAVTTLHGEQCAFPAILKAYDSTYDWITKQGFTPDGPPREVWHVPPAENNPDDHIEIVWPFREA